MKLPPPPPDIPNAFTTVRLPPTELAPAVVETQRLSRRFGTFTAVDNLDLEVRRGEVFGFLGPNGAGKSTLIRMLVGLLPPTSGRALVLGKELPQDAEALRSEVGYMTQRFSLYEDLTVAENLDFCGEIFGFDRNERRRRTEAALAEHELEARRDQLGGTLSGGWKQRLALAAATLHSPKLLVLDEPTAGVDPDRRRAFWEKIFELSGTGTTVLVSTHYMDEAVRCHRLCLLRRGRQVAKGTPSRLTEELEGRVISVNAQPPSAAIAALRPRPEVLSVSQLGHRVYVLLPMDGPDAAAVAPQLEQHLQQAGLSGATCEPAEPSLEDVFVAATLGPEGVLDDTAF